MPEHASHLTCEEFQQRICELLAADGPIDEHPHYRSCPVCRSLVSNLERMIANTLSEEAGYDDPGFPRADSWPEST